MANSYKVKFWNPASGKPGFIEGYRTARRAKEVARKYQECFARHNNTGVTAEYIGKGV